MNRRLVGVMVASFLAAGCPGQGPPAATPGAPGGAARKKPLHWELSKTGLGFRLGDADGTADAPAPSAPAVRLSAEDTRRVIARLPSLEGDPEDAKAFALRDRSVPAPRTGKTVRDAFPPPVTAPSAPPGSKGAALEVLRHAPDGPVALAPNLAVTFSRPMVPVTSLDALGDHPPPIHLSPTPPGAWRWVGTTSAVFQPTREAEETGGGRFPMATEYQVEVPAGTRATDGSALAAAVRWTFATPPPTLKSHHPSWGPQKPDLVLFASFDQAIDPGAIAKVIKLHNGNSVHPVRLATPEEIDASPEVRAMVDRAQKAERGRWLAFRSSEPLPLGTGFEVSFPAGTPSAEGPRRTDRAQGFSFRTYGPFKVSGSRCGWQERCTPLDAWTIELTNPVEASGFDKAMVTVDPPLRDLTVNVYGATIQISGRPRGRSTYKVTLGAAIPDTFGQTLGADTPVRFDVGPADPALAPEQGPMTVLEPAGGPTLPVFSINHDKLRVRAWAVGPEHWAAYSELAQQWGGESDKDPPGKLVHNRIIDVKKDPDALVETAVDLTPALKQGLGQLVVQVEPTRPPPKGERQPRMRTWVQATRLGLSLLNDREEAVAWVTALADGAPIEGAEASIFPAPGSARSGVDGIARVALGDRAGQILVARKGGDLAILPPRWGNLSLARRGASDEPVWFVFDDRTLYKPGEELRAKGWVRRSGSGKGGDLALPGGGDVHWTARDPRGAEMTKGTAKLDASGGFDFSFKIPAGTNLGSGTVTLGLDDTYQTGAHPFLVQEFRRPEFEVGASMSAGPHVVGQEAVATVSARYFAGGGLPAAPVTWTVSSALGHFSPEGREEFAFGDSTRGHWMLPPPRPRKGPTSETWTARTDAQGQHRLRIGLDALEPPYPMELSLHAAVQDVNRQTWSAHTNALVHPAEVYAGVRARRAFVKAGEALPIEVVTVDLDGKGVAGRPVQVRGVRLKMEQTRGQHTVKELDAQTCAIDSAPEPKPCSLPTKEAGLWKVTAVVTDAQGRRSQTDILAWVVGESAGRDRKLQGDGIHLVADKGKYAPGETAEILVMAPFAPAEGLLAVERQGLVHLERFSVKGDSATVRVKMDAALVPNALLHVELVGAAVRDGPSGEPDPSLPRRPAFAAGDLMLQVPPTQRTLAVKATPRDKALEPGGTTEVELEAKDAQGKPAAGAHLAVTVVDEALLALSGGKLPDPLDTFYRMRDAGVDTLGLRDRVVLARPQLDQMRNQVRRAKNGHARVGGAAMADMAAATKPAPSAAAPASPPPPPKAEAEAKKARQDGDTRSTESGGKSEPMAVRKDFNAVAAFLPRLVVDAAGRARIPLKLPDSLTRYRIMAVAARGAGEFGAGEATVTARLPLMVRPSAPRFLNYGDKFELPVVLQNQTEAPLVVDLAGRAVNARVDGVGRRVTVPPNDRVEVRLPAEAERPGTARFQLGAASGRWSDAAQIELPVWTPATTEAFATYGQIDEGAVAQPVRPPAAVAPEFGGLEITTSSTALSALSDAVLYLVKYPFECFEQVASRVVAVAALRDVLAAFQAKGLPSPEVLLASMKTDIDRLRRGQEPDGGWGFWKGRSWPFVSVHVAHALARAKAKGFAVDESSLQRARGYLASIERRIPDHYDADARRALIAYALSVRSRMGDADAPRARRLVAEAGGAAKLPIEALGWILPILAKDGASSGEAAAARRHLANSVTETAGAAHFVTRYADGKYLLLESDRRADGVVLEGLLEDDPKDGLAPKLVAGLLGHRKAGRWSSTQENAFVLLAMDRYFHTQEKVTPDFVARAWLGDRYAGEHAFKGRTTERHQVDVPMRLLAELGPSDLTLAKDGPGRLYYRIGMQYAPADLKPPPAEYGFVVSRLYEGADAPSDVRRAADGTWHVKSGARVRVRVSMVAPARRVHVALVDPLPAGFEPLNPGLANTEVIPRDAAPTAPDARRGGWWSRAWYEHQNMRDERVEAFTSLLWEGVYEYSYVARATTPGRFVVPPPKAEEMYAPETFGRGSGAVVVVE